MVHAVFFCLIANEESLWHDIMLQKSLRVSVGTVVLGPAELFDLHREALTTKGVPRCSFSLYNMCYRGSGSERDQDCVLATHPSVSRHLLGCCEDAACLIAAQLLSRVRPFATPGTAARPRAMGVCVCVFGRGVLQLG